MSKGKVFIQVSQISTNLDLIMEWKLLMVISLPVVSAAMIVEV